MCRSFRRLIEGIGLMALVLGIGLAAPVHAAPLANTCNGNSELSYPTAPNFTSVGDTVRIVLSLGAGGIDGGTTLSISRVRFNLDCNNSNLGINCPDDGGVVSYQGNLSTTCASAFTASHSVGDTLPNQVVFTPTSAIAIPANTPNFCTLSFDVRIETTSNDGTPNVIEEVSGFDASLGDGVCNTAPPLAAGNTNSGSITLCPVCDDGNQCNGVETCDAQLGCQPGTPIVCNDNNVCTTDTCDPAVPAPGDPCVFTPGAQGDCNDNNVCTFDFCDAILGCQNTPGAQGDCNDNDVCTTDTCDPINGCTHTPGAQGDCNDNDVCTTDTCDPINGCTHTPGAQGDCNDNDVCTTDTCDPINGCTHTPGAQGSCDDNDVCTTDTCDPINGCTHTPGAQGSCDDNDVCTTDVCNPIQGCTHTPGAQGSCDDNNTCTTDACDPIQGCTHTPGAQGDCNDNDVCTTDNCDPIQGCTHTPGAQGDCNDNNICTTDACDPIQGCTHTPGAQGSCDDKNVCTTDTCDPIQGCAHTPGAQGDCDDHNKCTTDACDPVQGCTHTPGAQGSCDDKNVCTTDACDPVQGCTHTPGKLDCDDHNKCTTDACDPVQGCTHTPGALDCDDHNKCTTDSCDPTQGCVNTPGALNCDDNDPCTDDACDPTAGCTHTDNGQCNLICRTPGFWGTHADADPGKACSQDITGAVIAMAGGSISVCGECIKNSNTGETAPPNDAASAVEAMCVRVQGQSQRQLARQLTAAALNCIISSGSSATCANTTVIDWATCNAVCQGTSTAKTVGECIEEIDAFNNGIGTGCHDRDIPLDTIFPGGTRCTKNGQPVQGPAGSNDECNRANDSACTIIQPNESRCSSDSCP